jgi:hypothetical protein
MTIHFALYMGEVGWVPHGGGHPPKDPRNLKNPKGSVTTVPFTGVFLKANPFLGKANPFLGKANLDSGPS